MLRNWIPSILPNILLSDPIVVKCYCFFETIAFRFNKYKRWTGESIFFISFNLNEVFSITWSSKSCFNSRRKKKQYFTKFSIKIFSDELRTGVNVLDAHCPINIQKQPSSGVLKFSCKASLLKLHFGMGVLL